MTESPRSSVPELTLSNSVRIPQLGFGVFQVPPEQTQEIVEDALAAGYRHIDTAAAYGNEAGVGAAIAASGIPRAEIFVTTKLRNGDQGRARAAFMDSRRALKLDTVDLYLIHWPVPSQGMFVQAWKELEGLYRDGYMRAIGVSNFLPEHLDALADQSQVLPAVNQIELHPGFRQAALAADTVARGIAVEAYSPLGQGAALADAEVAALADKYGTTPAQVVLAWHLGSGRIVIPKSANPGRLRENLAAVDLDLTQEELDTLDGLDAGSRIGADPATASFSQL
ncbi:MULTISPECIES: aldo/keto reductase [unclassified Arthrobacter]|uniref:aldo/keto reductase n=1 Tax=unclassified Arthrobacter TaxID=235627 RepID=UPI001E41F1C6|nr:MULTISPECIES: aldo/keto reductase [unclassified Arthrobacter]MCC9177451.1 aldo/keto reductase [Arthrobacter sp. zg-Y750]MDK1327972.1 aldo/keto reductase [Arthrobacter sp. zg-Y1143]